MIEIPNKQLILDNYSNFDEEYNFEKIISNYKSISQDLMKFAAENGMEDPDQGAQALFLADYVVTSSEVPSGTSDEERRISIIKTFQIGIKERNSDPNLITRMIYLSQKIGTLLRRNHSFLSDRGLAKDAGRVLLKDAFVTPYLKFTKEMLGTNGPIGWELGLIASSIKHELPDVEVKNYIEQISDNDPEKLFSSIWTLFGELEDKMNTNVNLNMVIPNIQDSKVLYVSKTDKEPVYSYWPNGSKHPITDLGPLNDLLDFLDKADQDKPLLFVNGTIVGTDTQIIMARDPSVKGKPLFLIQTIANEINLSEILALLTLRAEEPGYWTKLVDQPEEKKIEVQEVVKESYEDEIVSEPVQKTIKKQVNVDKPKKKGFFARILSIFGGGGSDNETIEQEETVTEMVDKKVRKKVSKKEKKEIEKILKREILNPDFLSHALGVAAVGNLGLFEIFDTLRETEYLVVGTMESDFAGNKTTLLTEDRLGNPEELANTLDGLDEVIEKTVNQFFGGENQIIPNEIFFLTRDDKRFLITLKGNEKRLAGTIAVTYVKDVSDWQDKGEDPMKRRSLHMRTGQLLSSLTHTPFDSSVERIYADSISKDSHTVTLDHAILSIEN